MPIYYELQARLGYLPQTTEHIVTSMNNFLDMSGLPLTDQLAGLSPIQPDNHVLSEFKVAVTKAAMAMQRSFGDAPERDRNRPGAIAEAAMALIMQFPFHKALTDKLTRSRVLLGAVSIKEIVDTAHAR